MQIEVQKRQRRGLPEGLKENKRLSAKISTYKKRIKGGDFNLKIEFETESSQIKPDELKPPLLLEESMFVITDYEVVWLDVDKVVHRNVKRPHVLFSQERLWGIRCPIRMARLIEFIEAGNKLFPAIIEPLGINDTVLIIDGNHRIALFRFLKLSRAPFLVKKKHIRFIEDLK